MALLLGLLLGACASPSADLTVEVASLPAPGVRVATITPRQFATATQPATDVPTAITTPSATNTATRTAEPSPNTSIAGASPTRLAPTQPPPPTATARSSGVSHVYYPPLVVANYLAWYDPGSWSRGCTSHSPAAGPYQSDDAATIARHVREGQRAGLDGFNVHWLGPGDRTDANLATVLAHSGAGFRAAVTFLSNAFGASRDTVVSNLRYVLGTYINHGAYLRLGGKPVIFFVGMPRIDSAGGQSPEQVWAEIRAAVDPNRTTIWMAEGLDPVYLDTFDGLYVYKIDHACCPYAYQSTERWQGWVRAAETRTGHQKYWAATIQPGWNDLLSTDPGCVDNRIGVETFARDREAGAYYQRTFNSAMATRPDILVVNSFNEWIEGSFIEPSVAFGDVYLDLTAQFATAYRASR